MVFVCRQKHVLREVDLYAMSLPNRDVRRNLHKAVHDGGRRLGNGGCGAIGENLGSGPTVDTAPCVICAAPAITPNAIDVPKISR